MATKKNKVLKLIIDDYVDGRQIVFISDDLIMASARLGLVPTNSFEILKKNFEKKFGVSISILEGYTDTEKHHVVPLYYYDE